MVASSSDPDLNGKTQGGKVGKGVEEVLGRVRATPGPDFLEDAERGASAQSAGEAG